MKNHLTPRAVEEVVLDWLELVELPEAMTRWESPTVLLLEVPLKDGDTLTIRTTLEEENEWDTPGLILAKLVAEIKKKVSTHQANLN